jgi:DNA-binding NtrC family response regulator
MTASRQDAAIALAVDAQHITILRAELEQFQIEMFEVHGPDPAMPVRGAVLAFVQIRDNAAECWARVAAIRASIQGIRIIALADPGPDRQAVEAFRAGVDDYLLLPLKLTDLAQALARILPLRRSWRSPLIGGSRQMVVLREQIRRLAGSHCNVLITGETGTGKELAAREIHEHSARARGPLVCVNCAAIPEPLLESELFGYERGAFTGAHRAVMGQLEAASGGTLLLDEIGDLAPAAQAKLLRAIETREVQRLGSRQNVKLDIRIVAATSHDMDTMVEERRFRADLYFRLNVGRVHIPPLRERPGDLRVIAEHFVEQLNWDYSLAVEGIESHLLEEMERYSWPGNVRELKNVLESSFVAGPGKEITVHELPEWFRKRLTIRVAPATEEERVVAALRAANWNKTKAAEQLQWSRVTLYRKMAQYQIPDPAKGRKKGFGAA